MYYLPLALNNLRLRSCVVSAFSGTVAPAQYFRAKTGGTLPRRSKSRWSGSASFSAKPSGVLRARAPIVSWAENATSTYFGDPRLRPQRISHTRFSAKKRRQCTVDTLGCDLNAYQTLQLALRRRELVLWVLWAGMWSFPY